MDKKLIIVAHPNYDESTRVKRILGELEKDERFNSDILFLKYEEHFSAKEWSEKIKGYNTIIFASPVWWYQPTWLYKKFIDDVLYDLEFDKGPKYGFILTTGGQYNQGYASAMIDHMEANYATLNFCFSQEKDIFDTTAFAGTVILYSDQKVSVAVEQFFSIFDI
ncbi:MAG: NAD(P)H-dependent oxidoreductase [Mycoplasma sp.]|nr:NAD(P)H-dependent oxidoreductase [Mycoplasma sp.]